MSLINKPNTFTVGATIIASEHNSNFDTIYNDYNGNIDNNNIAPSAGIVDTKLAQITTASKVDIESITSLSGIIVMWSGTIATIPTGWVICDGTNSTPDLTDRFVLHADYDSGGSGTIEQGTSGGFKTHTLTIPEMPIHDHPQDATTFLQVGSQIDGGADLGSVGGTTGTSGSGNAHNNRDRYYALAYIMKT